MIARHRIDIPAVKLKDQLRVRKRDVGIVHLGSHLFGADIQDRQWAVWSEREILT
jgi:hypothetical protein